MCLSMHGADQFIHCEVIHKATRKQFEVTVVYGFNDAGDRGMSWDSLVHISNTIRGA